MTSKSGGSSVADFLCLYVGGLIFGVCLSSLILLSFYWCLGKAVLRDRIVAWDFQLYFFLLIGNFV